MARPRVATAPPRRNACLVIREDVLNMTQERFAKLIGVSLSSLYRMETGVEDVTTIATIRACYAYAKENGLRWPPGLLMRVVAEE